MYSHMPVECVCTLYSINCTYVIANLIFVSELPDVVKIENKNSLPFLQETFKYRLLINHDYRALKPSAESSVSSFVRPNYIHAASDSYTLLSKGYTKFP